MEWVVWMYGLTILAAIECRMCWEMYTMRQSTYHVVCITAKFGSGEAIEAEEIGAEHEWYRNKRTLEVSACCTKGLPAVYASANGVQGVTICRSDIGQ